MTHTTLPFDEVMREYPEIADRVFAKFKVDIEEMIGDAAANFAMGGAVRFIDASNASLVRVLLSKLEREANEMIEKEAR